MTEPQSFIEWFWYFAVLGGLLIGSIKLLRWWTNIPNRYPAAFNTPTVYGIPARLGPEDRPTTTATVTDPCDHPYKAMTLTDLYTHLYESHWEVWNTIGDRNPAPATWHKEHRRDHNQL